MITLSSFYEIDQESDVKGVELYTPRGRVFDYSGTFKMVFGSATIRFTSRAIDSKQGLNDNMKEFIKRLNKESLILEATYDNTWTDIDSAKSRKVNGSLRLYEVQVDFVCEKLFKAEA